MLRCLWRGMLIAGLVLLALPILAQDTQLFSFSTQYPNIYQLGFSPDGQTLAVSSFQYDVNDQLLSSVELWDTTQGTQRGILGAPEDKLLSFAFSADGGSLYTGSDTGEVAVWNTSDWQKTNYIAAHERAPQVQFTPDGKTLVTSDSSGIIFWEAGTLNPLLILTPQGEDAALLLRTLIAPNSATLAGIYSSGEIRFLDMASGNVISTLNTGYTVEPYTAAFTPDFRLALGYETLELWDAGENSTKNGEINPGAAVYDVAFTTSSLALVDASGKLTLWDYPAQALRMTLAEGIGSVWDIAFNPDGSVLAIGRDAGIVELYQLQ
jgi:WD40 repeat protein